MVPTLNAIYTDYKENKAGLILLSIFNDASETDAQAKEWDTKHKVKYPAIRPVDGENIMKEYGYGATPTIILIQPAKSAPFKIVEPDIWPPENLETILKKYPISKSITSIQQTDLTARLSNLKVGGISNNSLSIYISYDGNYSLSLFNLNGALVRTMPNEYFAAGRTAIPLINNADNKGGTYIFTFGNKEESVSGKVIVK